jgi:hypothetical protein
LAVRVLALAAKRDPYALAEAVRLAEAVLGEGVQVEDDGAEEGAPGAVEGS